MKKVKFKILILILLFTSISLSTIDIKDNFVKNKDFNSNLDDFYNNKIHLAQSPLNSSSNWWNSLYNYRTPINITNINIDTIPQGYSVNISINTIELISSGKLRNDGNDLRIVWYNSSNKAWLEIDRINESNFNTIDTQIWFKTQDTINPETSDTNYYLYYGNPYALSPPMNRSKIYDFFDDFTQGNGPANGWSTISGTWSVFNNEYRENSGTQDCTSLLDSYDIKNSSIEVRVKTNGNSFGVGVKFRYYNESNFFCAGLGYWDREISFGKQNESGWLEIAFDGADESNLISDQWYDLKIESIGNHHKIYLDGLLRIDEIHNDHLDYTQIGFLTWTTNTTYYDDLKIRLLMSPEPTSTLGNEEIYRHSSDDFLYYKTFSINSSKVMGSMNLIDFPLLISIEDYDLRHHCRPDGNDIAFSNGTVWLDHEIELFNQTFNGTHAKLVAWVRIPSLSPTIDTHITMYYGNSTMNSQENPKGVWNTHYMGVWHLKEDPSDSQLKDSTYNSYHGTAYGSMTSNDQVEGQIAGSLEFDGLNDYINLGSDLGLKLTNAFTIETWYSGIYNDTVDTRSPIYCNGFSYSDSIGIRVEAFHSNSGREARIAAGDGISIGYAISDYEINDNIWTHLVGTYDGSTLKLYINGTKQIDELVTNIDYNTNNATIGINLDYTVQCYKGLIDELRVLNKECSVDWIATEYNNQFKPDLFYSIGKEYGIHNHPPNHDHFQYYKEIILDHTKVNGIENLINFPVLINILDSDLHDQNKVQEYGNDIAFSFNNMWLDHEIEYFNQTYSGTQAKLVAWVRIPLLSPFTDTIIEMYYGNSTMNSRQNPTGVWDDNYVGVWHLSEDPTGIIDDSTSNNNDGNSYGSMDTGDQILGKIDGSINFDGNDDNIATEENNLLAGCSSLTMSAWIKPLDTQSDYCGIIEYDNTTDVSSFDAGMELRDTGEPRVNIWTTSGFKYVDSSVPLPTTQFTYFVFVYDGDLNIYLDGSFDSSTPHSGTVRNNPRYINIGRNTHDGMSFNGTIDEIHISNINRSADWISTEYNNQYDPNSFYSVGEEYGIHHPPNHDHFKYYKEIIIDHTKVNGIENLINFPVLINILDSDLHDQNKVQEYGNDIAFSFNNMWLDHEIEYFNQTYSGTQAKLVAWVRIPLLSPFTDTIIEMYYGNSTMNSRQNPTEVWDNNFVGIWHLSEDPTETVYDSTSNNNDGTSYGSMSSTDQVTGKIDGSLEFDGDNDYIDCGNDNSLDITGDITIEFWVNGESFSDDLDPDILTKGNYTQAYSTWINDDGGVYFQLNGDSLVSAYKLPLGVWYSVVCTRSGSNRRIYINGTLDISDTFSNAIETITDTLTIARSPDNLNGTLDEIRLSNVSRSAEWIATEYNNQYEPDNFYYIGTENIIVEDTSAPEISINLPNPDDLFGWTAPYYNLSVIDENLDSIWYTLDGSFTNSSPSTAETGTIDQTLWEAQENENITIRFYANDTLGHLNYAEVLVRKDIIAPLITISEPNNYDLFGSTPPNITIAFNDPNLDDQWYQLDNGTVVTANYTWTGFIAQGVWDQVGNGTAIIRLYANDTLGNLNYTEVLVRKDIIAPLITISEPNNYDLFGSTPPNITIAFNDPNLDDQWYQLDNGTVVTANYTWTGFIAQGVWDQVGNGTVTITFYANDTLGNLNYTDVEVYKDIYVPIITIDTPTLDDVYNETAPNFVVDISGSNLDARWYTLDDGFTNYTFLGLTGIINQSAWDDQGNGPVIIWFYLNNTLGVVGFDEVSIIKDTLNPTLTLNLPLNNTYWREAPIINVLATDANLDSIWYEVNTSIVLLGNNINQQLDPSIWSNLLEGEFYIYIYANDSVNHLNDSLMLVLYKDTIAPAAPTLIDFPQGNVNGTLIFDWSDGSDPSGIIKYRLIIDNEPNPLTTPGYIFEVNVTESYYEYTETLQPGDYYFFLYQIDGAGHQSIASPGSFSIISSSPTPSSSEFPIWIIIVIIGAALGGVVGFVVLKKSKSKKAKPVQISQKKPLPKPELEIHEELKLMDYETLKDKSHGELNGRKEKVFKYIKYLEEKKEYTKAAEFTGELIIIEDLLGNSQEAKLYRQKQVDIALQGLEYLKDQYEIESKNAAISGDYSKALELYKESKLISDNLKIYVESQESSDTKETAIPETIETLILTEKIDIVYACINDLLTKYFDEIGIKYYSNLQIYDDVQDVIHGLILTDNKLLAVDIDPSIREKIKSIQIIYTEDISNENITKLCQTFQNPFAELIIVGIKWPKNIETQTIEVPPYKEIKYQENIRIIHHELFSTWIGLKGAYETAFNEIIDLYNKSELDILHETHESSEIIIHSTDELFYDLKEKGLVEHTLKEYFHR
ncbi:MAG: DUF2341 domain-containing protein [Promethearchaeota archaeon]